MVENRYSLLTMTQDNVHTESIDGDQSDEEVERDQLEDIPFISPPIGKRRYMLARCTDNLWPYCSSRWIFILLISLTALLYLLFSFQIIFIANQRPSWTRLDRFLSAQRTNAPNQQTTESSLQILYNLLSRINARLSLQTKPTKTLASLPVRINLNDSQTFALAEEESNVAAKYYEQWSLNFPSSGPKGEHYKTVTYCEQVLMSSPTKVKHNNLYWQVMQSTFNQTPMVVYLFNAYYDTRLYGKPEVKLITATDRQNDVEKKKWWCLLWFDGEKNPVLANVTEVYTIWPHFWNYGVSPGVFGPQIVSCRVPGEYSTRMPAAISLLDTDDCALMDHEPSNALRVINNQPEPKFHSPSIGICVQAFRFGTYDMSVRLVEWLEMVRLMGADQVYFYVYSATDNMRKVLRHYEKEGFVNWRRLTLPGFQSNVESLYNYYYNRISAKFWPQELLELNDCLYRNMNRHRYLGVFDIDEVIMPQTLNNWHELIHKVESGFSPDELKRNAYLVNRHSYIYEMFEETEIATQHSNEPIPEYLYTMRHTYRSDLFPPGYNVKCLHRTDLVTAVHNHFPMRCINTTGHHTCTGHEISTSDSILMHYRRNRTPPQNCKYPSDPKKCAVHDQTAWRYYQALKANVSKQLNEIFGEK